MEKKHDKKVQRFRIGGVDEFGQQRTAKSLWAVTKDRKEKFMDPAAPREKKSLHVDWESNCTVAQFSRTEKAAFLCTRRDGLDRRDAAIRLGVSVNALGPVNRMIDKKLARQDIEKLRSSAGVMVDRVFVEDGGVAATVSSIPKSMGAELLVYGRGPQDSTNGRLATNAYANIRKSPVRQSVFNFFREWQGIRCSLTDWRASRLGFAARPPLHKVDQERLG